MFGDVSIDRCAFRCDPGGQATGEADEVDADRRAEVDSGNLDAAFDTVIEDREVQVALLPGVRGRGDESRPKPATTKATTSRAR